MCSKFSLCISLFLFACLSLCVRACVCVMLCVHLISCNCLQRAEPRHHHSSGGRGGNHHPGVHGVRLHHWEKVRSRGPHWLSAPVSLRLSISLSVTHRPPRLWSRHMRAHTRAPIILWHAVLMGCNASLFFFFLYPQPHRKKKKSYFLQSHCETSTPEWKKALALHSYVWLCEILRAGWSTELCFCCFFFYFSSTTTTKHPAHCHYHHFLIYFRCISICMNSISSELAVNVGFIRIILSSPDFFSESLLGQTRIYRRQTHLCKASAVVLW